MSGFLYPVALDLTDRVCVVVGGGAVGTRRAAGLAAAGARVTVVDPQPRAQEPGVAVLREPFADAHLDHAFLAVAATDRPAVNAAVARAARERRVLLNQAASGDDDAEAGDFAVMAAVRRDPLVLAVAGGGPALSARLRREIDAAYGPAWGDLARLLADARSAARAAIPDPRRRAAALRAAADDPLPLERLRAGDVDGARAAIRAHLGPEGGAPCPT